MYLVFNSESVLDDGKTYANAKETLETLIKTFSFFRLNYGGRFSNALYTTRRIKAIAVGDYWFSKWEKDKRVDEDLRRKFKSMCDRESLLADEDFVSDGDDAEFSFYGCPCPLYRYVSEGGHVLLSLATDEVWEVPFLEADVSYDDGRPDEKARIKNFFDSDRLCEEDKKWLDDVAASKMPERVDLLSDPEWVFPSLLLHERALSQLENDVRGVWYDVLIEALYELNQKCGEWTSGDFDISKFSPNKVDFNSAETLKKYKSEYTFEYSGKTYIATHHMRYTPPGKKRPRIYFTPLRDTHRCLIYSLSEHFSCVGFPHSR